MDGQDGQGEVDGSVEHHGNEVVGAHTAGYQPVGQHVGAVRQLAVAEAVAAVGHGQTVGHSPCRLLESSGKGHRRINLVPPASPQLHQRFLLFGRNDAYLAERGIGMGQHLAHHLTNGIGQHLQRGRVVHRHTRLHANLVLSAFQEDEHSGIAVHLLAHGLHHAELGTAQQQVLLHIGQCLEVEHHARRHAQVHAEVGEGVDAMADGAHQLRAQAADVVGDGGVAGTVGQKGHRLDKHAHTATQTLVHAAVVHGEVGHAVLSGQRTDDMTERSLEE